MSRLSLWVYSVEKLGFAVILIQSGQLAQANPLFLLDVDFSEMSKLLRKGVFQQNRPQAELQFRAYEFHRKGKPNFRFMP